MTATVSNQSFTRRKEAPVHAFFLGAKLAKPEQNFRRNNEFVRCDHHKDFAKALDMLVRQAAVRAYDCVFIDTRHRNDCTMADVAKVAAMRLTGKLVVLAKANMRDRFEAIDGVSSVLAGTVERMQIVQAVIDAARDPLRPNYIRLAGEQPKVAQDQGQQSEPGASPHPVHEQIDGAESAFAVPAGANTDALHLNQVDADGDAMADKSAALSKVTKGFETTLSKVKDADQSIWQRFVPLANFVYKKLAIIVLTGLFLTFLAYGAMIVFFMTSSSWSLPFELSRGHALVEKAERDLSSLRLRQNQVQQELTNANQEKDRALRETADGKLQLVLISRTIDAETSYQQANKKEIDVHIGRLRGIISDFESANGNGRFSKNVKTAFRQRLITRRAMDAGTLAVMETMHRIATVKNEISLKQLERQKTLGKIDFLGHLKQELAKPQVSAITSAGPELSFLARDVIEAKNRIASSQDALDAAVLNTANLRSSLTVLTANIVSLEKTPVARALKAPVMVLFVPYANEEQITEGTPLYSCEASIFWCSKVGEVGAPVEGETVAQHPLFGKPMRGSFVEAKFYDPKSVTAELVHAGRAPLFF